MFMELCRGGDLLHYVRRRRKLDETTAKVIFVQIVRGLEYIHSKNVMHRDIKLENILLDNLGQVKICDFGVSKVLEFPDSKVAECCGTPAYMAPEVVLTSQEFLDKKQKSNKRKRDPKPYGKECDIWSLGVVLYALLYGQLPFRGASAREIKDRVVKGDFFQKKTISDEANSLIKSILVADLNKRLSISEILNHDWLKSVPDRDQIRIFNALEVEQMQRDFFFIESPDDWPQEFINNVNKEEHEDLFEFTYGNLNTTQSDYKKDVSDQSEILAPFNSSQSAEDITKPEIKKSVLVDKIPIFKPQDVMVFGRITKRINRNYERNFNQELDMGIRVDINYSMEERPTNDFVPQNL